MIAMVQQKGLLQSAMNELSAALSNAVGASSIIQHRLMKGEFRERRVIAGLRSFIPGRYEMTSGVVANANGDFSLQQDIILSDSMTVPPLLAAGDIGVHLIETVRAVIEVKSVATTQAMREAVKNIASVKQLIPDEPRGFMHVGSGTIVSGVTSDKPFGGILFLDSGASDVAIRDAFFEEASKLAPINRPNAAVVVNKFALMWSTSAEGTALIEMEPSRSTQLGFHLLGANALLAFYVGLIQALGNYEPPVLDLTSYLRSSGGLGKHEIHTYDLAQVSPPNNDQA